LRANLILSQPQYLWISNLLLANCWSATCSHRACCAISFCWLLFFISCSILLFML
jgi:predicted membrane metal-binding protein